MKSEYKEPWVKALRSGDFKQGTEVLYNAKDGSYCCLGVLNQINDRYVGADFGDTYPIGYLTYKDLELYDMPVSNQYTLMRLNDENRLSFNEIADYIEEHL